MRGRPYYPYTAVIMLHVRRQDDRLTSHLHMYSSPVHVHIPTRRPDRRQSFWDPGVHRVSRVRDDQWNDRGLDLPQLFRVAAEASNRC